MNKQFSQMVLECLCAHHDLNPLEPKCIEQNYESWKWAREAGKRYQSKYQKCMNTPEKISKTKL